MIAPGRGAELVIVVGEPGEARSGGDAPAR